MRIIAGQWRGRKIEAPFGDTTRPTSDRARESLFSMLASRIGNFEYLHAADIFAGTGALGLEALSRGAAHCTFIEQDRKVAETLKANIKTLNAKADIRIQSALNLSSANQPCDLVFLDPPYGSNVIPDTLSRLKSMNWLTSASWLSIETANDENIDIEGFSVEAERKIGKAQITLLRVNP